MPNLRIGEQSVNPTAFPVRTFRRTRHSAMSTVEETPLQPRDRKATEDSSHTSCTERLEPLQVQEATTESAQGVTVAPLTTNGWKKCFITVTILITYAFLNAGISIIAPFYPIVVSCLACMVRREATVGLLIAGATLV